MPSANIYIQQDIHLPQVDDHKLPSSLHNMDPDMDLMHKPAKKLQEN